MRWTLLLCMLVSQSCSLCRSYCEEHPKLVYMPASTSCLTEPPPVDQRVVPDEQSCPPQFALCLDGNAGSALEQNIKAHRRWEMEAMARCSPLDAGVRDGGL